MIRVFLDANILFSAAYRENNGITQLWNMEHVRLVTSAYAITEAERNLALKRPEALARLAGLTHRTEISSHIRHMDHAHGLPAKDLPILEAAAGSHCTVLLTGDIMDFGHLLDKTVENVRIMTVSTFLRNFPSV